MNKKRIQYPITLPIVMLAVFSIVQCETQDQETVISLSEVLIQSSDGVEIYYQMFLPRVMEWMDSVTVDRVFQLRGDLLDENINAVESDQAFWDLFRAAGEVFRCCERVFKGMMIKTHWLI